MVELEDAEDLQRGKSSFVKLLEVHVGYAMDLQSLISSNSGQLPYKGCPLKVFCNVGVKYPIVPIDLILPDANFKYGIHMYLMSIFPNRNTFSDLLLLQVVSKLANFGFI